MKALFIAQEERGFYSMILIHKDGTAEWGGSVGKPPTYRWPHKASLGFLNFGTIAEIRNGDEVVGPNSAVTIGDELTGIIPNHGFTLGKVVSPETAYEMLCKGAAKEDQDATVRTEWRKHLLYRGRRREVEGGRPGLQERSRTNAHNIPFPHLATRLRRSRPKARRGVQSQRADRQWQTARSGSPANGWMRKLWGVRV